MDFIIDVITNYPLMSAAAGWIVAQVLKTTTGVFKIKKFSLVELFCGTGGMPSSHAASVSALACACALKEGVASPTFAISMVLALIDGACEAMPNEEKKTVIDRLVSMANDKLAVGQGEPIH